MFCSLRIQIGLALILFTRICICPRVIFGASGDVPPLTCTTRPGQTSSSSSTRQRNAAVDMQTEAIGRELRRFGDDYNRQLLLRGMAGGHRRVVIQPNPLPHIHQEPAMLLCVGLLVLLIGRIFYLQGSTNSQDHSQV